MDGKYGVEVRREGVEGRDIRRACVERESKMHERLE